LHHERESFRSGWSKASELLGKRVYQGEIPEMDAVFLARWYQIRGELLEGKDTKKFDEQVKVFNSDLPEEIPDKLVNAMKIINGYLSENGTS